MSNENILFWCETCSKKYFLEPEGDFLEIKRSDLQKKIPHIDHESNKKTTAEYSKRKSFRKCKVCGYLLKEIKNEK